MARGGVMKRVKEGENMFEYKTPKPAEVILRRGMQ
jgi:hypothetical protein